MGRKCSKTYKDAATLRNFLQMIDKLREAEFIKHHIFVNDAHTIQFTERGMRLVRAIHDIESAIPELSSSDRYGLWNLFRMTELCEPPDSGREDENNNAVPQS